MKIRVEAKRLTGRRKAGRWQRFEALAAQIQAELAPDSEVKLNQRLPGKISGGLRQIDITVRKQAGQYDLLIVVECKDYTRPVNVKQIEEFMGLVEDVQANKGAVISSSGFSEKARVRAEAAGIDLYDLVDAEEHDWQSYVSIPMICDFRGISRFSFTFQFREDDPRDTFTIPSDPKTVLIRDSSGQVIDCLANLLARKWSNDQLPSEPGTYGDIVVTSDDSYIRIGESLVEVRVLANIEVVKKLYFGNVPLIEVRGFRDPSTGEITTRRLTTGAIDVVEVEQSWKKVASIDELAVKPVLGFMGIDQYPLIDIEPLASQDATG